MATEQDITDPAHREAPKRRLLVKIDLLRLPGEAEADYKRRYRRERYRVSISKNPDFRRSNAEKAAKYRKANPERANACIKAARAKKPYKYNEIQSLYYQRHKPQIIAKTLAHRALNPGNARETNRLYKARNKAKIAEAQKHWPSNSADEKRRRWQNRRTRERGADGKFTANDLREIRAAQKDRCGFCKVKLLGKGHLDHIMPLAKGGTNFRRNLQWLCRRCNLQKSAKDPINFAHERGLLL